MLILLFIVATAVALLARRLRLPYTVALVLAGLVLGQLHAFEPPHLTQELLFAVFLPGLLFEAAFHLDFREFRRDQSLILALAVPGVLAAILLTAAILVPAAKLLPLADALTWEHALVFGALVAATDPIAVVGLFRSLGAPQRLAALLEGESLLNDGTSIVFFTMILGVVGGASLSASDVILEFVRVVGLGAGVGFVIGLVVSTIVQRVDDPMIEITLTTIAAYGAFAGAEQLHGSGVIATVVAGMLCGNYAARTGMTPTTRVAVETFWEYVAFALNSLIFLLIGFEVRLPDLLAYWQLILSAFLAVLVGRAIIFRRGGQLLDDLCIGDGFVLLGAGLHLPDTQPDAAGAVYHRQLVLESRRLAHDGHDVVIEHLAELGRLAELDLEGEVAEAVHENIQSPRDELHLHRAANEADRRIEHHHCQAQVTHGAPERPGALLLDDLGGAFEPGDSQQRGRVAHARSRISQGRLCLTLC